MAATTWTEGAHTSLPSLALSSCVFFLCVCVCICERVRVCVHACVRACVLNTSTKFLCVFAHTNDCTEPHLACICESLI